METRRSIKSQGRVSRRAIVTTVMGIGGLEALEKLGNSAIAQTSREAPISTRDKIKITKLGHDWKAPGLYDVDDGSVRDW